MTHQPAISFSITFLSPFNRAGGRTSNVSLRNMGIKIATTWYPSSDIYSVLVLMVSVVSVALCFVVTLPKVRATVFGKALMLVSGPILFVSVFFCALGSSPSFPGASDLLATHIAIGAGYLLSREATHLPTRSIRVAGWIEVIGFATLAGSQLFFLSVRG